MANYRKHRNTRRRNNRKSRKNTRRNNMRGGFVTLDGSNVTNTSMNSASNLSLEQGKDYSSIHENQHGGVAPVGEQGLLDDSLRSSAHLAPLDRSFAEISGMSDQAGGRRRRNRKGRKSMKSRKSRKSRRSMRRRSMRGGVMSVDAPTTLLTGDDLKGAVEGMNPEWKLVEDATAFNPRM